MNSPTPSSDPMSARGQVVLSWLLAGVAGALALVAAIVVFALHSQQTSLEESGAQLLHACTTDEADIKHLAARNAIAEAEYQRLAEDYLGGAMALKQGEETQAKRKALVEQSTKIQNSFQGLAADLLFLAKIDDDAKAIVAKYNIGQNPSPSGGAPAK